MKKVIISNKKYRIISSLRSELIDYEYGEFHLLHTVFKVQVKTWFGWITIKEFEENDEDDVEFISNEAEELYNKIVNTYSII